MSLTLQESAALVGSHCWAERRLFELLGLWSAEVVAAGAVLCLDRHSQHAAWRAGQWWDRLPVLSGVDRDALVIPTAAWSALAEPVDLDLALVDPALVDPALVDPDAVGRIPSNGPPGGGGPGGAVASAGDVARLAWAYRVALPRLAVAYARHESVTAAAPDGAVRRTLGHVRPDIAADWAEGEAVLQALLRDDTAVAVAARVVRLGERRFLT